MGFNKKIDFSTRLTWIHSTERQKCQQITSGDNVEDNELEIEKYDRN